MKLRNLGLSGFLSFIHLFSATAAEAQSEAVLAEGVAGLNDMRCSAGYRSARGRAIGQSEIEALQLSYYSSGVAPIVEEKGAGFKKGQFSLKSEEYDPKLSQLIRLSPNDSDSIRPVDLAFIPRIDHGSFVGYEVRLGHVRSEVLEEGRSKDERIYNALKNRAGGASLKDEYYYSAVTSYIPLRAWAFLELELVSKNAGLRSVKVECWIPGNIPQNSDGP